MVFLSILIHSVRYHLLVLQLFIIIFLMIWPKENMTIYKINNTKSINLVKIWRMCKRPKPSYITCFSPLFIQDVFNYLLKHHFPESGQAKMPGAPDRAARSGAPGIFAWPLSGKWCSGKWRSGMWPIRGNIIRECGQFGEMAFGNVASSGKWHSGMWTIRGNGHFG